MPTWDDLQQMKYLKAIISETTRFFSPASFLNRSSIEEDEVCGCYIPKNVRPIINSVLTLHSALFGSVLLSST